MRAPWMLLFFALSAFSQDTEIVLLGTGTPNAETDRSGPAVAIRTAGRVYIVDAGPGVVRRAAQAGIAMKQLNRAFLTHLHSDHTAGLPDLLLTPAVIGRLDAMEIYGPPGTAAMVDHLRLAYQEDIEMRLHGGEPSVAAAYGVNAHEIQPGIIYSDDAVRVIAFPVKHGAWKYAYGYRFEAKDRTIVISGDCTYSPSLIAAAKGADILVHEVYSRKGWERRTPDWQAYHAAFHTSGADVGKVAAQVKPKKLVLYHQLPMGEKPDQVLREVREQFDGEVIYGTDLLVVK